mmetsp:Transcript_16702/g.23558  ORF Transcript_16702/g.23558 Transcript_16702/m.23558 type:complete len:81 (-) Transcript_16702:198-440(-)
MYILLLAFCSIPLSFDPALAESKFGILLPLDGLPVAAILLFLPIPNRVVNRRGTPKLKPSVTVKLMYNTSIERILLVIST